VVASLSLGEVAFYPGGLEGKKKVGEGVGRRPRTSGRGREGKLVKEEKQLSRMKKEVVGGNYPREGRATKGEGEVK